MNIKSCAISIKLCVYNYGLEKSTSLFEGWFRQDEK